MISRQQIKYISSLQQKKYRNEYKTFVVEGYKMVNEAVHQQPESVEYICYTPKYSNYIEILKALKKTIFIQTSVNDFSKISSLTSPQEILAVMKQPELVGFSDELQSDLTLALDSVRDPGNLGTIIRLCDWFGIRQVFCSTDAVDCYNPKVVQASMGAILRVRVFYTDLSLWLSDIAKNGNIQIYGTGMDGRDLYKTKLQKPAVLILGNESTGISGNISDIVHENLCIPNYSLYHDKSESLNVSIAAAIFCAEFKRQL